LQTLFIYQLRFREKIPGARPHTTARRLVFAARETILGEPGMLACYTHWPQQNKTSTPISWTIYPRIHPNIGPIYFSLFMRLTKATHGGIPKAPVSHQQYRILYFNSVTYIQLPSLGHDLVDFNSEDKSDLAISVQFVDFSVLQTLYAA
jgi:hypothetical protein